MRLWTFSPRILDRKGLGGQWVEALLAKTVLPKSSGGYTNHPQLNRFRACSNGAQALDAFLHNVWLEATTRGYNYNLERLGDHYLADCPTCRDDMAVTLRCIEGGTPATPQEVVEAANRDRALSSRVIPVTAGQVCYEWRQLLRKLKDRDHARYTILRRLRLVFGAREAYCEAAVEGAGLPLHSAGGASYYLWRGQVRVVRLPRTGLDWVEAVASDAERTLATAEGARAGMDAGEGLAWLGAPADTCGAEIGEGEWFVHEEVFAPGMGAGSVGDDANGGTQVHTGEPTDKDKGVGADASATAASTTPTPAPAPESTPMPASAEDGVQATAAAANARTVADAIASMPSTCVEGPVLHMHAELLLQHVFAVVAGGVEDWEVSFTRDREERDKKTASGNKAAKSGKPAKTAKSSKSPKTPKSKATDAAADRKSTDVATTAKSAPRKRKAVGVPSAADTDSPTAGDTADAASRAARATTRAMRRDGAATEN